jgi:uncharacterized protein (DUF58 family)
MLSKLFLLFLVGVAFKNYLRADPEKKMSSERRFVQPVVFEVRDKEVWISTEREGGGGPL